VRACVRREAGERMNTPTSPSSHEETPPPHLGQREEVTPEEESRSHTESERVSAAAARDRATRGGAVWCRGFRGTRERAFRPGHEELSLDFSRARHCATTRNAPQNHKTPEPLRRTALPLLSLSAAPLSFGLCAPLPLVSSLSLRAVHCRCLSSLSRAHGMRSRCCS